MEASVNVGVRVDADTEMNQCAGKERSLNFAHTSLSPIIQVAVH